MLDKSPVFKALFITDMFCCSHKNTITGGMVLPLSISDIFESVIFFYSIYKQNIKYGY